MVQTLGPGSGNLPEAHEKQDQERTLSHLSFETHSQVTMGDLKRAKHSDFGLSTEISFLAQGDRSVGPLRQVFQCPFLQQAGGR